MSLIDISIVHSTKHRSCASTRTTLSPLTWIRSRSVRCCKKANTSSTLLGYTLNVRTRKIRPGSSSSNPTLTESGNRSTLRVVEGVGSSEREAGRRPGGRDARREGEGRENLGAWQCRGFRGFASRRKARGAGRRQARTRDRAGHLRTAIARRPARRNVDRSPVFRYRVRRGELPPLLLRPLSLGSVALLCLASVRSRQARGLDLGVRL